LVDIDRPTELDLSETIEAIVEVAQGHPLALELLTGKLLTQGSGSIRELSQKWQGTSTEKLSDEFLSALCNYVFDDHFLEIIGAAGAELLSVIALTDRGIKEENIREASGVSWNDFDATLSKLFEAGCIHTELRDDVRVLTMHPFTQAYFRTSLQPRK